MRHLTADSQRNRAAQLRTFLFPCYNFLVLSLLRKNKAFFAVFAVAAFALRAWMFMQYRTFDGDSLVYGDIAKNWLTHGIFGLGGPSGPVPTYIRLPGYPAFLAAVWAIFGLEHYTAVLVLQILADVVTCVIIADLARRTVSDSAAKCAFALAALCPFLATYTAAPLTETLAILFAAVALDAAVAGMNGINGNRAVAPRSQERCTDETSVRSSASLRNTKYQIRNTYKPWLICGLAIAASILLRPDGGILLGAVGLYLLWTALYRRRPRRQAPIYVRTTATPECVIAAGLLVAFVSLVPLVPWAIRNWRDFHRFQPLAPRYANAPDEPVYHGFQRWVRTWMVDYASVADVYWVAPDSPFDLNLLPSRAFDSPAERQQTEQVFNAASDEGLWTAQRDAILAQIATERVRRHPVRYYLALPTARIADMWLRPRTERFGITDRWWEITDHPSQSAWAILVGLINLAYITAAIVAVLRYKQIRFAGLLILFVVLRSLFLGSLENPEPRYTLECYPVVLVFAAAALTSKRTKQEDKIRRHTSTASA